MTQQETQNQLATVELKPADLVVANLKDVADDLTAACKSDAFLTIKPSDVDQRLLSFLYQLRKIKKEDLVKIKRGSFREAFKASMEIGVPVDTRQLAYLTMYGTELTYHIGYKGLIYMVRKLRPGIVINVHLLYEGDEFAYTSENGRAGYSYKPIKAMRDDFQNVTGGFVFMSWVQNGQLYSTVTTMSRKEINEARSKSKSKNGPWLTWPGEMMKKVILRRACKVEFIGEPLMDRFFELDDQEYIYEHQPTAAEKARNINYANVRPLEDEPEVVEAEVTGEAEHGQSEKVPEVQ